MAARRRGYRQSVPVDCRPDRARGSVDRDAAMTKREREPMTEWQRFALVLVLIAVIVAVIYTYAQIKGGIA
jgi:hypothetical protein